MGFENHFSSFPRSRVGTPTRPLCGPSPLRQSLPHGNEDFEERPQSGRWALDFTAICRIALLGFPLALLYVALKCECLRQCSDRLQSSTCLFIEKKPIRNRCQNCSTYHRTK